MNRSERNIAGLIIAMLSFLFAIGSMTIAIAEGGIVSLTTVPSLPPSTPTREILSTNTPLNISIPTATNTPTPEIANTNTPESTISECPLPDGWIPIVVHSGETIEKIAEVYVTTPELILSGNCLLLDFIQSGSILFVPNIKPSPSPSKSDECGQPPGWVLYTVQSKDTLYSISKEFNISVEDIQWANCMGSSTFIRTGTKIYLP